MLRFAISDLHLADKGPRDNFHGVDDLFNHFLDYVQSQGGTLYILGDLFDFWQVNLSAAVMAYLPLLNRISQMDFRYVIGNHDSAFKHFLGHHTMPDIPVIEMSEGPFEETIGERRFAFLHGHEADPTCNSDNPGIGELTAIMSGMLEDKNKGPIHDDHVVEDKFIGALEAPLNIWRSVTHQTNRRNQLIDGVEAYRISHNADVVVSGHTHEPGHIGNHHFNTGRWSNNGNSIYVRIPDSGEVTVHEWTTNGPKLFEKELR